jgi:hypothetical protein
MNKDIKEAQQRHDLEWVMSTEQGRRFVWRLLSECKMFHDIVGDGHIAFRQIGRRQVGLFITDLITQHVPDSYMLMQTEHQRTLNEERLDERNNSNAGTIDDYITGNESRTYIDTTLGHVTGL